MDLGEAIYVSYDLLNLVDDWRTFLVVTQKYDHYAKRIFRWEVLIPQGGYKYKRVCCSWISIRRCPYNSAPSVGSVVPEAKCEGRLKALEGRGVRPSSIRDLDKLLEQEKSVSPAGGSLAYLVRQISDIWERELWLFWWTSILDRLWRGVLHLKSLDLPVLPSWKLSPFLVKTWSFVV